jgi:hypothetical protein
MAGVKGRSGAKPHIKTQLDEELNSHPERILGLMEKLYERGMSGDIGAATYYIDRVMGKPTSVGKLEADIKQLTITPDDLVDMPGILDFARQRQAQMLASPVITELDESGVNNDT